MFFFLKHPYDASAFLKSVLLYLKLIVIIIRNNEKFLPVRMTFITSWRLVRAASDLRAV